jgi:hypothetical protein
MANETESKSQEDIDAEKAAAEYRRLNHPDIGEGKNVYSDVVEDQDKAAEEEKRAKDEAPMTTNEKYTVGAGAGAGAYATHKDLLREGASKFLTPAESTYKPVTKPTVTVQAYPEPLLPNEVTALDNYDSDVEKMMQSIKDKNKPTGSQNERSHNWESNRESLATKNNLKTIPNADKAIVEAGRMTPMRSTNIGIPEHLAYTLEEEELRREAQRRVAEETAKREAEAKLAAEKQAQAEIRAAQEAEAARAAKISGIKTGVARVGLGALGGALGAKDIYDVTQKPYKDWNEEDYLKLVGGAGGLLSTIPTPITEGAGIALAGGALAYPYAKRAYKHLTEK